MRLGALTVLLALAIGVAVGIGGYAFVYAKGYSYLLNNPSACANCHVMREQFDSWIKSSHRSAATCNDCHTPHNLVGKYSVKAMDGFFHSFYFTTGLYPDNIQITNLGRRVTENACRRCHQNITQAINPEAGRDVHGSAGEIACTRCHYSVGHLGAAGSLTMPDPSRREYARR